MSLLELLFLFCYTLQFTSLLKPLFNQKLIIKKLKIIMDYTEENLMRLRNSLPWGYAEKLQDRILEKTGKRLIRNSIRRHLTLKYANTETITEAMLLAEEYKKERQDKALLLAKRR